MIPWPHDLPIELHDRLTAAYQQPHRAYHNLVHIEELFRVLTSHGISPSIELQLAIWFHDVIYDPCRSDNEELSAQWASRELKALNWDEFSLDRIERMIRLTKHGHGEPESDEERLLLDADLAILGSSPERYDEYARQIRKEYEFVPIDLYGTGRSNVLKSFLDRAAIYQRPEFAKSFESQARENLSRELSLLAENSLRPNFRKVN